MMVAENVQAIFESLHGQIFGSVTVRDARVMPADDEEGDDALYLALVLSDPDGDTWPLADVKAIRRRVVELSLQAGIPAVVFVRMLPESDAPQADDDAFRI